MTLLYQVLGDTTSPDSKLQLVKQKNSEVAKALKAYPTRFYGFGAVPLGMSKQETINWIKTEIIAQGFSGIGEFTPANDEQIMQLETIFQALTSFKQLPMWVHTFDPVTLKGLRRLMKLTEKHPEVTVIYGHMGGYHWMELLDFVEKVNNAYLDLSGTFSSLAVSMAISTVPNRCLFSSDTPYGEPWLNRQLIEFISPSKEISTKVLGGNILNLLNVTKNNL